MSPACSAGPARPRGLRVGDIDHGIDDNPIEASQPSDEDLFATMIRQYKIGSTRPAAVLRDGKEQKVAVKLDQSPRLPREMKKYEDPNFEFRVRDITAADQAEKSWTEGGAGVLVEAVREGGWAALGQLADGDLLMEIDGRRGRGRRGRADRPCSGWRKRNHAVVVLKVRRGIRTLFVELQSGWPARQAACGRRRVE